MKKNDKKNKHMTLDDRIEIQECLCKGVNFKLIGKRIGKSQTTVSREVKLHLQPYTNGYVRNDGICPRLLKAPFVCNGCEKKGEELHLPEANLSGKIRTSGIRGSFNRVAKRNSAK